MANSFDYSKRKEKIPAYQLNEQKKIKTEFTGSTVVFNYFSVRKYMLHQ